jgi:hypothetical protein
MEISTIHESLVNGQRRQMVAQIDEYGLYDFWANYAQYLVDNYDEQSGLATKGWTVFSYYKDAVTSYHRIKAR